MSKVHLLNQPKKKTESQLQCVCGNKEFNFKNINGVYYIICTKCKDEFRIGMKYQLELLRDKVKDKGKGKDKEETVN